MNGPSLGDSHFFLLMLDILIWVLKVWQVGYFPTNKMISSLQLQVSPGSRDLRPANQSHCTAGLFSRREEKRRVSHDW